METGRLEVWGEMLNRPMNPPRFDLSDNDSVVPWTDTRATTPIEDFQKVRQLAESRGLIEAERYVVLIKCTCGAGEFYPSDAVSGKFTNHTCETCGKTFTAAECRVAFRRGTDEKIARLCRQANAD